MDLIPTTRTCTRTYTHIHRRNAYIYYVNKHHVIDAKDYPNAMGRFANDSKGPYGMEGIKNNSQYVKEGNGVFIKSLRVIPAGSEILVGYGKGYWYVLRKNIPDFLVN